MDIKKYITAAADQGHITNGTLEATAEFLHEADARFEEAIATRYRKVKGKLRPDGTIDPKTISGTYTTELINGKTVHRPLIDLVQQGGGMYGIALLGYTYIMEKLGIRFYSYGGTSAGAINATFLAAIPNSIYEQESVFFKSPDRLATKSELLTHIILNRNFSTFMERGGIVGRLQRFLFRKLGTLSIYGVLGLFALIFIALLAVVYSAFGLIFSLSQGLSGTELRLYDFVIGSLNVFAVAILFYVFFIRVLGGKFGLNTGNAFYGWCDGLLQLLNVTRTEELTKRMGETKFNEKAANEAPRLVLIASNLTHNRIVKFPERAVDYWSTPSEVKPAAYLRATMSLPFIFEVFIPELSHYRESHPGNRVRKEARFVDGGMLSNFPIREFHRTDGKLPRFPTFGVLLSRLPDGEEEGRTLRSTTLFGFVISFLKTFRYFYDKDFVDSNDEIALRVVTADTRAFNWLDFWMDTPTKKALFLQGVDAALRQLEKFDWDEYYQIRGAELQAVQKMRA